ncbi:MAG: 4-hydroxy-tetrahydrodipicolinate reductase [Pseudomonadota bacterium]
MTVNRPVNVGLFGAGGRMGKAIETLVSASPDAFSLKSRQSAQVESTETSDADAVDVWVDFTVPETLDHHLEIARRDRAALVIGTTGLSDIQQKGIDAAARDIPIVQSYNMSVGINLLQAVAQQLAATLSADEWDIEVLERHHRHKIDAPSGTAYLLAKALQKGRGGEEVSPLAPPRSGSQTPRQSGEIGIAAQRGGSIAGDHSILFAGPNETIEIMHHAADRAIFAHGALRAAAWAAQQPAGRYTMLDVLGIDPAA